MTHAVINPHIRRIIVCVLSLRMACAFSTHPTLTMLRMTGIDAHHTTPCPQILRKPAWPPMSKHTCMRPLRTTSQTPQCTPSRSLCRRVSDLEAMLQELCDVILLCDDVALAEREALKIGPIFMDTSFSMYRKPRLLRQETQYLMHRHGKRAAWPNRVRWRVVCRTSDSQ